MAPRACLRPLLDCLMTLFVNGERRDFPASLTVRDLIGVLGLAGKACAVEVNGQLVPYRQHAQTALADGDRVEVVTLVGGG